MIVRASSVVFAALTQHERFWLDVIRIATNDTDPAPTLALAQQVRCIFSQTVCFPSAPMAQI